MKQPNKLSAFQIRMLGYCYMNIHIDARPSQLKRWQRRELNDLVTLGLLHVTKDGAKDKYGCYSK